MTEYWLSFEPSSGSTGTLLLFPVYVMASTEDFVCEKGYAMQTI